MDEADLKVIFTFGSASIFGSARRLVEREIKPGPGFLVIGRFPVEEEKNR